MSRLQQRLNRYGFLLDLNRLLMESSKLIRPMEPVAITVPTLYEMLSTKYYHGLSTYFIHNKTTGLWKIGITEYLPRRRNVLEKSSGCRLDVKYVIYNRNREQIYHNHFKRNRVVGEWFKVNRQSIVASLKKHGDWDELIKDV